MSTTRITISVPEQIAVKAQRAVESGHADSVSGYFTGLAEREPDWTEARAVLDDMIAEAGGLVGGRPAMGPFGARSPRQ
ncbi:MAG: hypothetical protein ACRDRH_06825 [Pseudonocardia sp.]